MAIRLADTDRRAVARAKLVYLLPLALVTAPVLYALAGVASALQDLWDATKEAWNRPE